MCMGLGLLRGAKVGVSVGGGAWFVTAGRAAMSETIEPGRVRHTHRSVAGLMVAIVVLAKLMVYWAALTRGLPFPSRSHDMSQVTFHGNPVRINGRFPVAGEQARPFTLVGKDLADVSLSAFKGKRKLLNRSEEHTSELQSLMRISYAVFCLKNKNIRLTKNIIIQ